MKSREFISMELLIFMLGCSIFNYTAFFSLSIGLFLGEIMFFTSEKIKDIITDKKIKKFLTEDENEFYVKVKNKEILTKNECKMLKLINDYLNGKVINKDVYNIQLDEHEFLLNAFHKKYGNINPEELLKD